MNRSFLSAFEERNRPFEESVRAHLAAFAGEPAAHARLLNMLSLLEHIGSRKIMTCRAMRAPGLELLKHLTEESRHAFFFKRAAVGAAGRALPRRECRLRPRRRRRRAGEDQPAGAEVRGRRAEPHPGPDRRREDRPAEDRPLSAYTTPMMPSATMAEISCSEYPASARISAEWAPSAGGGER